MKIKVSNVNTPNWKDVNVKSHIPAELEKLSELAHNIWWACSLERSGTEPRTSAGTYELC